MGDQTQKAPEAEPAQVTSVIEEPHESHSLRRENVRGILAGRSFSAKLGAADDPEESQADSMVNAALTRSIQPQNGSPNSGVKNQTFQSQRQLSDVERSFFEPRFNADFSDVRLNYSSQSSRLAKQINARAFTQGSDIHFSNTSINFDSNSGRKTLAHELAHVVQNRQNGFNENIIRREIELSNRVEFDYSYRDEDGDMREDAENIELSVLVRIFYNLQRNGLIAESEHLGDDLSYCQQQMMDEVIEEMGRDYSTPSTYEAALRVLVTDANDDGRFDINADLLNRSGLLESSGACVTDLRIQNALNDDYDPAREWLEDQSSDADNSRDLFGASTEFVTVYGGLTDEGRAVERLDDQGFETDIDRYYSQVKASMRESNEQGDIAAVVTAAIAGASDLNRYFEHRKAAQLLAMAFRSAVNDETQTTNLITAIQTNERLERVGDQTVDIRLSSTLWFDFDRNEDILIDEARGDFRITIDELIELAQTRMGFINTVDSSVEGDVQDTPTLSNMTEYMHQLVSTATLAEVKTALGNALSSQFVHSGGGVDYEGFPGSTRSDNMQDLYDALSQDGAGRYVIDCDGFVAFARHFLDDGSNRFGFVFMDKRTRSLLRDGYYDASTHALLAVLELETEQGFIVDNHRIRGDFTFEQGCSDSELIASIGEGLRAMGYESDLVEVYMSLDQSIYDAGDDPNRWSWQHWSPSQDTEREEESE